MNQPLDQDEGLAHCHYIRLLAMEIWIKEKEKTNMTGDGISWDDAIKKALDLHVRKLKIKNVRITKLTPVKPISANYCGWGW